MEYGQSIVVYTSRPEFKVGPTLTCKTLCKRYIMMQCIEYNAMK